MEKLSPKQVNSVRMAQKKKSLAEVQDMIDFLLPPFTPEQQEGLALALPDHDSAKVKQFISLLRLGIGYMKFLKLQPSYREQKRAINRMSKDFDRVAIHLKNIKNGEIITRQRSLADIIPETNYFKETEIFRDIAEQGYPHVLRMVEILKSAHEKESPGRRRKAADEKGLFSWVAALYFSVFGEMPTLRDEYFKAIVCRLQEMLTGKEEVKAPERIVQQVIRFYQTSNKEK
jgi:hypothetical protein